MDVLYTKFGIGSGFKISLQKAYSFKDIFVTDHYDS